MMVKQASTPFDSEPANSENENRKNPQALHLLVLGEAGADLPDYIREYLKELHHLGHHVRLLAMPKDSPQLEVLDNEKLSWASVADNIKDMARDFLATIQREGTKSPENEQEQEDGKKSWLSKELQAQNGPIDAIISFDPWLAKAAFPLSQKAFPEAMRIAISPHYHLHSAWSMVPFDAFITPHPSLGAKLPQIQSQEAFLYVGGPPLPASVEAKRIQNDESQAQVIVSLARMAPEDIDPLFFQLSLAPLERVNFLFLTSHRPGIDELVESSALHHGVRGKRLRNDAQLASWLAGSQVLLGLPSPHELALANSLRIPTLFVSPFKQLHSGDRFLIQRGGSLAEVPLTVSVQLEALLPGGTEREQVLELLKELPEGDAKEVAQETLFAIMEGRPKKTEDAQNARTVTKEDSPQDGELEDIGGPRKPQSELPYGKPLPRSVKMAYLKDIILQQHQLEKQLARAHYGMETWSKRVGLARNAGDMELAKKASARVEGLRHVIQKLESEHRDILDLRARFSSQQPISHEDRMRAGRLLSMDSIHRLDRQQQGTEAFTQLEVNDALRSLKRRMNKD